MKKSHVSPTPLRRPMQRRDFLKALALTGAATLTGPRLLFGAEPNQKVRLACIGIGNRGAEVIAKIDATRLANIVALCDTEMGAKHTLKTLEKHPTAPRFKDFRKMFDKMGKEFDAVMIATPDFSHFPITMLAMAHGKHVYVEKPMGHSFRQIELMMAGEKKYKVACQMGNQGHSEANYFQFKAWVDAGIIKNVTQITAYMNNPRRWHGMKVDGYLPAETIPDTIDWDAWLATARVHPYNKGYLNGEWRSWFDFGNGALGDWGAHIFDTAHEFLNLGLPTEVDSVKAEGWSPFIFPQASTLRFKFPARGSQPPMDITWYDGQENLPPLPNDLGESVVDTDIPPPSKGATVPDQKKRPPGKVIYGEGLTFKGGSHGSTLQIIPEQKAKDLAGKLPVVPKTTSDHFANFLKACKGEEKTRSNFAVAGPLCQTMALGIIAQQLNQKLTFNPATRRITDNNIANELLDGPPPRKDWEQFYKL